MCISGHIRNTHGKILYVVCQAKEWKNHENDSQPNKGMMVQRTPHGIGKVVLKSGKIRCFLVAFTSLQFIYICNGTKWRCVAGTSRTRNTLLWYCIYVIEYSEIIIQEGYVGAMWSHLNVRKRRSSCWALYSNKQGNSFITHDQFNFLLRNTT